MDTRKTIGERLLERVDRRARLHVRPASTRAFEDRYSRFARTRGMSRLGLSLFPGTMDAATGSTADGADARGPTFLSGLPFWSRLRRLGRARLRRQQWVSRLSSKYGERGIKSRMERVEPARLSDIFGLDALSLDDLTLLEPETSAATDPEAEVGPTGRSRSGPMAPVDSPWFTGSAFVPAQVTKGMRPARPLEHAETRAPTQQVLLQVIEQAVRAAKTATVEVEIEELPAKIAAKVRRAIRRQARKLGLVQPEVEAALPDELLPPAAVASGRAAPRRGGRRRGLRTVTSSSPMMAELAATTPPEDSPGRAAGALIAERTAHRITGAKVADGQALSTSPVGRPAPRRRVMAAAPEGVLPIDDAVSPVVDMDAAPARVRTAGRAEASRAEQSAPAESVDRAPASTARAARRADPTRSEDSISAGPVDRLSVRPARTGRTVRSRESYTPDTTVIEPDGLGVEASVGATSGAEPRSSSAGAPVVRATAHVARRGEVARLGSTPTSSPADEVGDVTAPTRRRASKVVRASDGRFVPQTLIAAPGPTDDASVDAPSTDAVRGGASPTPSVSADDGGAASPLVGAAYAAERITQAQSRGEDLTEGARSLIPKAIPRQAVAQDLILPDADEQEPQDAEDVSSAVRTSTSKTSAGVRAATRAQRTPVVGYTAARTARPSATKVTSAGDRPRRDGLVSYARTALAPETVTITVPIEMPVVAETEGEAPTSSMSRAGVQAARAPTSSMSRAGVQAARATHGASRPLDWSEARVELMAPEMVSVPGTRTARARARTTQAGAYIPASVARSATARPTAELATDLVLPLAPAAPSAVEPEEQPDRRVGFDHTVRGVGAGRVDSEMPIWAQRATGAPRIRGSEDLVDALAKAGKPDEVVQVLMERSSEMSTVASTLPSPVIQVIQQIQTEARSIADDIAQDQVAEAHQPARGHARPDERGRVRSSARVIRGMTGLRPRASSASTSAGMQKVTALAQRLQQLIDMAERNKDAARREVRMAEDSHGARAEGSASPAVQEGPEDSAVDVDALSQEVTEAVTRELEMRRERRLEDPDGSSIWWE